MKMIKILSIAVLAAAVLQSCKKDDNNDNNSNSGATTMKVRMTDAPGNYSAMHVQVTKVEAYLDNTGWVVLDSSSQNVSVLDLTNGAETQIAYKSSSVPTGHYSQLRFTFGTTNTVTVHDQTGDNTYNAGWTGASDHTLTINIDKQVNSGTQASLLVDFNAAQSVSSNILGNYSMTPVITWIEDESTGVKGTITGADQAVLTFTSSANTYTTYMADDGKFLVRGMVSGSYTLTIDGMHTGQTVLSQMTMNSVIVANGAITNMNTITFN
jgi:hypothetical protein